MSTNTVPIEQFYDKDIDGDDYYPAICKAQAQVHYESSKGALQMILIIEFDAKDYKFSQPIELIRCVHLKGSGDSQATTHFIFPKNKAGIIIHNSASGAGTPPVSTAINSDYIDRSECGHFFDSSPLSSCLLTAHAALSIIENIFIEATVVPSDPNPYTYKKDLTSTSNATTKNITDIGIDTYPQFVAYYNDLYQSSAVINNPYEASFAPSLFYHGIVAYAPVTIINCSIWGFLGHGVYLFGEGYQSTDGCVLENVDIQLNHGNGLHVIGGDSGLHTFTRVFFSSNIGWGAVAMSSGSGSTFIDSEAANNQKGGFLNTSFMYYKDKKDIVKPDISIRRDELKPAFKLMEQNNVPYHPNLSVAGVILINCYGEDNWYYGKETISISYDTKNKTNDPQLLLVRNYKLINLEAITIYTFDDNNVPKITTGVNYAIADDEHVFSNSSTLVSSLNHAVIGGRCGMLTADQVGSLFPYGVVFYSGQSKQTRSKPVYTLTPQQTYTETQTPLQYVSTKIGTPSYNLASMIMQPNYNNFINKDIPGYEYFRRTIDGSALTISDNDISDSANSEIGAGATLVLKYKDDPDAYNDDSFCWEFRNLNTFGAGFSPLRISSYLRSGIGDIGELELLLDKGFYIGTEIVRTKVTTASTIPDPIDLTQIKDWNKKHQTGRIALNVNPIPNDPKQGYAGWIYCPDNQWRPFGKIEDANASPPVQGTTNIIDYAQKHLTRTVYILVSQIISTAPADLIKDTSGNPFPVNPAWTNQDSVQCFISEIVTTLATINLQKTMIKEQILPSTLMLKLDALEKSQIIAILANLKKAP